MVMNSETDSSATNSVVEHSIRESNFKIYSLLHLVTISP